MLRKGKTKNILENAIDSALLAVEIYNKPRTTFRVENYISLMIIAWTKLFHAYFRKTIGDKYYEKEVKNGIKYKRINGEKKTWALYKCIKEYKKSIVKQKKIKLDKKNEISDAVFENIKFFIELRNKIEHSYLDKKTIDAAIFGECQSLLYNFENTLELFFGEEYSINENLAFSLQFSRIYTKKQKVSQKKIMQPDEKNLFEFINTYKSGLSQQIIDSQEYAIKLICMPKISNKRRNDLAVTFVKFEELTKEQKESLKNITVVDKDHILEAKNVGKHKPGQVVAILKQKGIEGFKINNHSNLWKVFKIRPSNNEKTKENTNNKYCSYDKPHKDFLYTDEWVAFLEKGLKSGKIKTNEIKKALSEGKILKIQEYE